MQSLLDQNVSEIAAGSLDAVRVFERYGIDYCCGGKRPLGAVLDEQGIAAEALVAELESARRGDAAEVDWTQQPLTDLVRHIMARHHDYLKSELPVLSERLAKVLSVYDETERLAGLGPVFGALRAELESHLQKEEMILFPFIERMEAGEASGGPCGWIGHPIAVMEHEHDSAGDALRRMRQITGGYVAPEGACVTYRSLLAGLEELERDLHMHIHLENNILFPRAMQLERGQ